MSFKKKTEDRRQKRKERRKRRVMGILRVVIVLGLMVVLGGCGEISNPFASTDAAKQQAASDKFTGPENKPATAVESALILSDKYSKATEQLGSEQTKNIQLTGENEKLKAEAATLQVQLAQTQKELGEANQLLMELQKDLNNWKADVIGFRDEMRKSQQSQLEALTRIMLILGAEAAAPDANGTGVAGEPNAVQ